MSRLGVRVYVREDVRGVREHVIVVTCKEYVTREYAINNWHGEILLKLPNW